jgi:hypothetical protein
VPAQFIGITVNMTTPQTTVSVYTVHHHVAGSGLVCTGTTLLCRQYGRRKPTSDSQVTKLQVHIFVNGVLTEQTIEPGPSTAAQAAHQSNLAKLRTLETNSAVMMPDITEQLRECRAAIGRYEALHPQNLSQGMVKATRLQGTSTKAKMLCAAHNSATVQTLQTRRMLPPFLSRTGITKETLNNPLYCPVAIDMLKAVVWQSMLLNADAIHVHELFSTEAVRSIDEASDLWRSHDVLGRLQDAEDSDNFIQASTGMYDVSKLLPRRSANPVSVVNCIADRPYFHDYLRHGGRPGEMECTHDAVKDVVDRTFPELRQANEKTAAADFVLRDFWHKTSVTNLLRVLQGHLTQGQSVSMSSSNGTMVDELVKVMEQVRLQSQQRRTRQHRQLGLTYTDCIDVINEAPQVCKLAALAVEDIMHADEDPGGEWLSVDTPSFQFGLLYKGGKFLGIHPDGLRTDDDTLHTFELKTKWMLNDAQIKDGKIIANIPSGTYRDHVNQCITQGISSTVAYGQSPGLAYTTLQLCIVAVPYEPTVQKIRAEVLTHTLSYGGDNINQLAKDMYTSIIAGSTFTNFKDNTFYGYTDKTYTISKESELILWVIASMRGYDNNIPLLYRYLGEGVNELRPIKTPTLAQLGLGGVVDEGADQALPFQAVYLEDEDLDLACWICPVLTKSDDSTGKTTAVVAAVSVNGREVQTAEVAARLRNSTKLGEWQPTGANDGKINAKAHGQNARGTVKLLHIKYGRKFSVDYEFDLSGSFDANAGVPVCFLFPQMQKGPTGVYYGATFVSDDNYGKLFDIPTWFQEASAYRQEFIKPLAKYRSAGNTSAKGKKKAFHSLFTSCELLDIDVMLQHIEDTSMLVVYTPDAQELLTDVQNASLMWYQQVSIAEAQWPFNIVRKVAGVYGTDADSIVIRAQTPATKFPLSVLAPYKETFQVYTKVAGAHPRGSCEYRRNTNADGHNVLHPGLAMQTVGKRPQRSQATVETVKNTLSNDNVRRGGKGLFATPASFYEFITAVLPQHGKQTVYPYFKYVTTDKKEWAIKPAWFKSKAGIQAALPYVPKERAFFDLSYPGWMKKQKPKQIEWQLAM